MSVGEEVVICVPSMVISALGLRQGFTPVGNRAARTVLAAAREPVARGQAEVSECYKQLVTYGIFEILRPDGASRYLVYRRKGGEGRLDGRWSIGVGGHVEPSDGSSNNHAIHDAMSREVDEELDVAEFYTHELIGIINDDSDPVGRVHLGVVYHCRTSGAVTPRPAGNIDVFQFPQWQDLRAYVNRDDCESWSKILLAGYFDLAAVPGSFRH